MKSQSGSPDQDPFQDLIRDLGSLPACRPELPETIFAQTRGVLSRRRWWRRGQLGFACLLCYAVGIGSGWLLKPSAAPQLAGQPATEDRNADQRPIQQSLPPSRGADSAAKQQLENHPGSPPDAAKVVQTAPHRAKISPFENFRRVGDRQLIERGNVRGAMDYYRRALRSATDEELQVQVDRDTWLLISLKQSQLEERKNAQHKRA